jgi:hypothetical protein
VFEKRVLKRITGSKRDDITRGWRNLQNELNLYSSLSMDRDDMAQDRDQWRALVNMAMNLRVP